MTVEQFRGLLSHSRKAAGRLPFRLQLGRALLIAESIPRLAVIVAKEIGDRLEGKPIQKMKHELPHKTIFYNAAEGKPAEFVEAERRAAAAAGNSHGVTCPVTGPDA